MRETGEADRRPAIIQGLPPGPHKIVIQLVDANQTIDQGTVKVMVPIVDGHVESR